MEQDPLVEKEIDSDKQIESLNEYDKGIDMLERPENNDFVAGLKSFIIWIKGLFGKKD